DSCAPIGISTREEMRVNGNVEPFFGSHLHIFVIISHCLLPTTRTRFGAQAAPAARPQGPR
ncbi:MAG: hypothetical protein PVJ55_01940, partial [Anaerolineae bacterium]